MKINKGIVLVLILLIIGVGIIYSTRKNWQSNDVPDISSSSQDILPPQDGLPAIVEWKRQEIYKATIERDYDKLSAMYPFVTGDSNEWFEANTAKIISVLRAPFSYQPYIPANEPYKERVAEYVWTLDEKAGEMKISITESGEWNYVGGWD